MISSCSRLDIIVIELGSIPGSCQGVAPSRPKRGNPTNGDSMPKHTTLRKNKIQKRNIEGIDWIQWIESEDFQRQAPATGDDPLRSRIMAHRRQGRMAEIGLAWVEETAPISVIHFQRDFLPSGHSLRIRISRRWSTTTGSSSRWTPWSYSFTIPN